MEACNRKLRRGKLLKSGLGSERSDHHRDLSMPPNHFVLAQCGKDIKGLGV